MNDTNENHIPSNWGADPLGSFIEEAQHNTIATFANLREQYDSLAEIDRIYLDMVNNLNQSSEFVAGFFLIRTHSSFRGAVRLSLSGQIAESYMVLRACLESALYGLYVSGNTNRQEIWLRRHDDDASRRRCKSEFTIRNVLSHLQTVDSKTHGITKMLYERTIDYGGHPNERAVNTQIKIEADGSRVDFTAEYFLCGDLPQQLSLKSSATVGICCLDMFYNVFRDRFRILRIDERLDEIRQGF